VCSSDRLEFSIETDTEAATGASIEITFHNETQGTISYLTSPQSTVFVPITPYTATYDADNPHNNGQQNPPTVNTNDVVYVEIRTVPNTVGQDPPNFSAMGEVGVEILVL